jgi:bacterioferritin
LAVKGSKEIIRVLNEILTGELTAINQYFLHAKMQQNWGFMRLYKHNWAESIDEMKHANALTERILYLDGIPNLQKLGRVRIGENVKEQLEADQVLEEEAIPRLNRAIEQCREEGDNGTRVLLEGILTDEEEHLDWVETQLQLIQNLGETAYLTEQMVEQ